jgi:hypothetical protein
MESKGLQEYTTEFFYFHFTCSLFNDAVRNLELHNGKYMTLRNELEIMLKLTEVTKLRQHFWACLE